MSQSQPGVTNTQGATYLEARRCELAAMVVVVLMASVRVVVGKRSAAVGGGIADSGEGSHKL